MTRCPKHVWEWLRESRGVPLDPDIARCIHCGKVKRVAR